MTSPFLVVRKGFMTLKQQVRRHWVARGLNAWGLRNPSDVISSWDMGIQTKLLESLALRSSTYWTKLHYLSILWQSVCSLYLLLRSFPFSLRNQQLHCLSGFWLFLWWLWESWITLITSCPGSTLSPPWSIPSLSFSSLQCLSFSWICW